MYCRYREVSPVCIGKHRELRKEEQTKEHLIPKSLMRIPKFKSLWNLSFHPSNQPNIDISCPSCNNLKNNMADVPFVWKLQYFQRFGLSLKSERSLHRTLQIADTLHINEKQQEKLIQALYRGNLIHISKEKETCILHFSHQQITLKQGVVTEIISFKEKVPRKLKKQKKVLI